MFGKQSLKNDRFSTFFVYLKEAAAPSSCAIWICGLLLSVVGCSAFPLWSQVPGRSNPSEAGIGARLETTLRTDVSIEGDAVTAILRQAVRVSQGVAPKGSRIYGRVETVHPARLGGDAWMRLVFREAELQDGRRVPAWMTNSFHVSPPRRLIRHFLYAGFGALAGSLLAKDKTRNTAMIGGALGGFLIANNTGTGVRELTLQAGQDILLNNELGREDVGLFRGGQQKGPKGCDHFGPMKC